MRLKLKQVWASQQAIPKLLNRELASIRASYLIGKNCKALDAEVDMLNRKRIDLVKRYGKEDETTKQWTIADDRQNEFNKQFEHLLETEINVEITPISISELTDARLSPLDTVAIDFMLKE